MRLDRVASQHEAVHRDEPGDIRQHDPIPTKVNRRCQLLIEFSKGVLKPRDGRVDVRIGDFGCILHQPTRHDKRKRDVSKIQVQLVFKFKPPTSTFGFCFSCRKVSTRTRRKRLVQISKNVIALNVHVAVMNKDRDHPVRVDAQIPVRFLFAFDQIDWDGKSNPAIFPARECGLSESRKTSNSATNGGLANL